MGQILGILGYEEGERRLEEERIRQQKIEEDKRMRQQRLEEERIRQQRLEEERIRQQKIEVDKRMRQQRLEEERIRQQKIEVDKRMRQQRLEEERIRQQKIEINRRKILQRYQIAALDEQANYFCPNCEIRIPGNCASFTKHILLETKMIEKIYGKFECPNCFNYWESAIVWGILVPGFLPTQVYPQDCKNCKKPCFAFESTELICSRCQNPKSLCTCDAGEIEEARTKPHRQDLCHRCRTLGSPCWRQINKKK